MQFFKRLAHHFLPSAHNAYRPHLLRTKWLLVFLFVILAAEAALVANVLVRQAPGQFFAAVLQSEIILLTNAERREVRAPRLEQNQLLTRAAQRKAEDMAARGYFAHVGPDGKQPWQWIEDAGYEYHYAGENLAVRFVDSKDVIKAWMASPTHRKNIVKPVYSEIGVGVATGVYKGKTATYVVQFFGTPMPGTVAGVATASTGFPQSLIDTLSRQVVRLVAEPQQTTFYIIGGTVAVLAALMLLAFVFHIQIQPRALLMPAALVVAVGLSCLGVNSLIGTSFDPGQGASTALSVAPLPVDVTPHAAEYEPVVPFPTAGN